MIRVDMRQTLINYSIQLSLLPAEQTDKNIKWTIGDELHMIFLLARIVIFLLELQ